jgi:hypothetical protein
LDIAAQHITRQQNHTRANAFSTRGQQMVESSSQVRMMAICLRAHQSLDHPDLLLNKAKKVYRTQKITHQ